MIPEVFTRAEISESAQRPGNLTLVGSLKVFCYITYANSVQSKTLHLLLGIIFTYLEPEFKLYFKLLI